MQKFPGKHFIAILAISIGAAVTQARAAQVMILCQAKPLARYNHSLRLVIIHRENQLLGHVDFFIPTTGTFRAKLGNIKVDSDLYTYRVDTAGYRYFTYPSAIRHPEIQGTLGIRTTGVLHLNPIDMTKSYYEGQFDWYGCSPDYGCESSSVKSVFTKLRKEERQPVSCEIVTL